MADIIVNGRAGSIVTAPIQIPDDHNTVTLSLPYWTQTAQSIGMLVELSLDAGQSWRSIGEIAPTPGVAVAPTRGPFGMTLSPLPLLCSVCGGDYLPGDGRYARALTHSTVALRSDRTLAEMRSRLKTADRTRPISDFKLRIMTDEAGADIDDVYLERVFHTPSPVLPADRLLRTTVTATRNLSTIMTVTSS